MQEAVFSVPCFLALFTEDSLKAEASPIKGLKFCLYVGCEVLSL